MFSVFSVLKTFFCGFSYCGRRIDLKMSTVHVTDVCRAVWHLTGHGNSGDVFNLADKSNTSKMLFKLCH